MKHVVSVSLGTSKRDKESEAEFLGEQFNIKRLGTDGDKGRYAAMLTELDGKIDCFGVGGTDVYLYGGGRRYTCTSSLKLMQNAVKTPWVDGSGLKHTLERETVGYLQENGIVDFAHKKVLLMSAVDRFGMAEALVATGGDVIFGDILFGLGLPVPVRRWSTVNTLAKVLLPVISKLPTEWFYPTGAKQEKNTPKFQKYFDWADVIAGDWHFIRRYMPQNMQGKIILTQSSRKAEIELLRERGVDTLITTTPEVGGEAFATNVMEAVLVVLLGGDPSKLTPDDYLKALRNLGWRPRVMKLSAENPPAVTDTPRSQDPQE